MHLKSLELMGFKSFGRKTVFEFSKGLTAIVGPNGSGKSNVCDAIRWVLGEQSAKTLRGTKMSEVIFAGSPELSASAFAQVKLTLDNEDGVLPIEFAEAEITRQLYRSGESNYILNGTKTLLSTLKELLMDTGIGKDGYSIIGQGDIDDIIFQKIQSRRALVEEAAGITKFKHRKESAESKLKNTRDNMLRINDIISEIEGRLEPLKEQADKTLRYRELSGIINELESALLQFDLAAYYAERSNIESMKAGLQAKIEEIEAFMASVDEKKQRAGDEFAEFENALQLKKDELAKASAGIEEKKNNVSEIKQRVNGRTARNEAIAEELAAIETKLSEGAAEIEDAKKRLADIETAKASLTGETKEAKAAVEKVKIELSDYESSQSQDKDSSFQLAVKIADQKTRINNASQQVQMLERNLGKGESDVKYAKDSISTLEKENEKIAAEINIIKAEIESNTEALKRQMKDLTELEREGKNVDENLMALSDQVKIHKARLNILEELQNSAENGIYRGVQAALALKDTGRLPGIYGIVGNLIKVPAGYETAFETALGGSIQDIVTDSSDTAKEAINFLKRNKAGRATFLPLDIMTAPRALDKPAATGCLGTALDLVEFDAKFYTVMSNLLGRILIFDNLDNAVDYTKTSRNFGRIVTLSGDIVRSSGAMTGGGETKRAGGILAQKREQDELAEKIEGLEGKEKALKNRQLVILRQRQELAASVKHLEDTLTRSEQSLSFFERNHEKNAETLKQKNEEFKHLFNDHEEINSRIADFKEAWEKAQAELVALENEERLLSAKMSNVSEKYNSIQARLVQLTSVYNEKQMEEAKIDERRKAVQRELESALRRQSDTEQRKISASEEIASLKNEIAGYEKTLKNLADELSEADKQKEAMEKVIAETDAEYKKRSREMSGLEAAYRSRAGIKETTLKKLSELDIKLAEIKTRIEAKETSLREDFNMLVDENAIMVQKYENREDLSDQIDKNKFERELLEPVNPLAVDEYEKTKERFDFLTLQVQDLASAAASLEQVIAEIEKISAEKFTETFEQIKKAYSDIFEILFPGGEGTLKLKDPKNPLQSDIDIICRLPGKKLSTLELFSGGEKSLISIAMLFSILQVKPPAFCLLDEIEAALDEANVKRFNRMLRSFADKTQFLLITHNKETMQNVDVIYGVTMSKNGISKPVSIRLEDENKIKEFTVGKGEVSTKSYNLARTASGEN